MDPSRAPAARAHLLISGQVQGVGFRYELREAAERAGLTGWVRNLRDGRVEALLEGDPTAVEAVIGWCRRGPPGAQVADVAVRRDEPSGEFPAFTIERTPGRW
jgi:acylphosphatase